MTHELVLKTFIVYITLKAMIFLPLAWAAAVFWWNDRPQGNAPLAAE